MTHALPDTTPDPQPTTPDPQATSRPELFTLQFWLIVIARVVRGAAVGGTAGLGAGAFDTLASVPWQAALTGTIIGAIMSLAASLANQFIPDTNTGNTIARFTGGQG